MLLTFFSLLIASDGVDDALQQHAHSHLNGTGDIVRIMFFDFSSASNTCAQDGRHHFYSEQVPSAFLFTSTTVKRAACTSYPMTMQCLGDDSRDLEYRKPLRNFVERSGRNHLFYFLNYS